MPVSPTTIPTPKPARVRTRSTRRVSPLLAGVVHYPG
jgi:hypothetical protein